MDTTSNAAHAAPLSGRKVDQLLAHYGESHRNPRNEAIHYVAIPLIILSLLGLLFALHPWAAYAFVAASMVYYARLSAPFLIAMALLSVAIFVAAWIAQFVGHKIEGKKPSFLEDLRYLWVGPLFVLAALFTRMGIRW